MISSKLVCVDLGGVSPHPLMSQEIYSSWQPDSSVSITSRFPYRLFISTVLFSVKPPSCFEHTLICLTCHGQKCPHGLACLATLLCCLPFIDLGIWSGPLFAEYILAALDFPSFPSLCWNILICGGSQRWVSTSLRVCSFSLLDICFLDFSLWPVPPSSSFSPKWVAWRLNLSVCKNLLACKYLLFTGYDLSA